MNRRKLEAVQWQGYGKRSALLGLLQTRYGHAKKQAEREIDLWIKQLT
jgi:uncharacterized protein YjbJ (UPF0337 family)